MIIEEKWQARITLVRNNWKIWPHDVPESGVIGIALYGDGSGAILFYVDDNGIVLDAMDDELSPEYWDESLFHWCELPDEFKFWEWSE